MHKTLVIIPAYNEENSIGEIVAKISESAPLADVVVINDGSTDATSIVAQGAGAYVINLPHNLGIGGAVQTGYIFAEEMGYDIAIQVDADGQHDPAEIPRLISPLLKGKADMVVGSRYAEDRGYEVSPTRRLGAFVLASVTSLIVHQKVTDPTSGFRAVNRDVIEFCAIEYPHDYPEPETLVLLHRAGFAIQEIPVPMSQRRAGQSSITFLGQFYYLSKVLLAILIGLLRKPPRRRRAESA